MYRRLFGIILAGSLILFSSAIAEEAHEHAWGEWSATEKAGHVASCLAGDGAVKTANHYISSVNMNGKAYRVCLICGDYGKTSLDLIGEATAVPVSANPALQRGNLVVRGKVQPFEEDKTVVYAFTVCYERDGGLGTFKNQSMISFPLPDMMLTENFKLIRVQSSAGDDSVQNPEKRIEMNYDYQNKVLSFSTKTPALYLLIAD